ncbi:hypothetical protein GCM10007928_05030 [Sulfitobacter porphyrae]|nr:hypothetical protein GCM10007928_05030 [Sulfitobacter porphyrae]
MRLTCPNCDAQYEVPDDVMPATGRDVQCSNCGQTWFQHHPDHAPEEVTEDAVEVPPPDAPAPDEETAPPPPPARPAPAPERRKLDPAVADILRQEAEAEHEARKRRQEQAQPLESQPDLGLDVADPEDDRERRALEARRRMARMRGEPEPLSEEEARAAAMSSRRELLPDIEEINSTLRSDHERGTPQSAPGEGDLPVTARGGGFGRGFMLVILCAAILIAIYVFAPQIARAVPQVDPYLSSYVSGVDQLRLWLDRNVQDLLIWLDSLAAQSTP